MQLSHEEQVSYGAPDSLPGLSTCSPAKGHQNGTAQFLTAVLNRGHLATGKEKGHSHVPLRATSCVRGPANTQGSEQAIKKYNQTVYSCPAD